MRTHGPHGKGGQYRGVKNDPLHESDTGRHGIGDKLPWVSERFLFAWRWSARVSLSTGLARVTSTMVPSNSIPEERKRWRKRRNMPTCCLLKLLNLLRDTCPLISEPHQPQSSGVEVAKMIRFSRCTFRNDAVVDEIETKKLFTGTNESKVTALQKHHLAKLFNSLGFNMGRWIRHL